MPRYFTIEEARASLPAIREEIKQIQTHKRRLDQLQLLAADAGATTGGNGYRSSPASTHAHIDVEELAEQINAALKRIAETGCLVKDIDAGLLDWPWLREGREVYLCWRLDEADIQYWHEIADGFAGRRPL